MKIPKKYQIKGYKRKYYKARAGWKKAIAKCQDAAHKGYSYDVTRTFRSRVCRECKTHSIVLNEFDK